MKTIEQICQEAKALNCPGWCSPEKGNSLVELIYQTKPSRIVEIGTFGFSSAAYITLALKEMQWGKFIGIDPWSVGACLEDMKDPANIEYWSNQHMLENVYQFCLTAIKSLQVDSYSELIKAASEDVYNRFEDESINILHIDGSHSAIPCMRDAHNYLIKVKPGGVIYCDDEGWSEGGIPTVKPMIDWLCNNGCTYISSVTGCAILVKDKI